MGNFWRDRSNKRGATSIYCKTHINGSGVLLPVTSSIGVMSGSTNATSNIHTIYLGVSSSFNDPQTAKKYPELLWADIQPVSQSNTSAYIWESSGEQMAASGTYSFGAFLISGSATTGECTKTPTALDAAQELRIKLVVLNTNELSD